MILRFPSPAVLLPVVYGLLGVVALVSAWELLAAWIGNPGLVPPLSRIAQAGLSWASSGLLMRDALESVPRAWLSLSLAVPLGVFGGLALALAPTARRFTDWQIQFLRSLPPVALLPLFIIWFGIDWESKLAASVIVCIFPVLVTTIQGATLVDTQYRELRRDYDLGRWVYVRRILLPGTMPALVPGVRLSAGTAFIMLYVSELAGASSGLGYRISVSQLAYQADLMIATLAVLGLFALATDLLIQLLASIFIRHAGKS